MALAALSSAPAESEPARVVAGTDLGKHTVPLSKATEAEVLRLRDAIRPVWNPRYDSVQEAGRVLSREGLRGAGDRTRSPATRTTSTRAGFRSR